MPTGEPAGSIPNVGASPDSIKGICDQRRHYGNSEAIPQQSGLAGLLPMPRGRRYFLNS